MNDITINIQDYGFTGTPDADIARVTAVFKERYELITAFGPTFGFLKPGEYFLGYQTYPTTGDFVRIEFNPSGDSRITQTLPRRSSFSRREAGPLAREQSVAANFDYVLLVTSLNHDFNPRRMERYLTVAYDSGALPVVVLTKADLVGDPTPQISAMQEIAPGVDICAISSLTGYGLDTIAKYAQPGKTLALLGSSGVGKSSLLNALAGQTLMRVNETRAVDTSKGRHTTTHRQLFMLDSGAMIIDTPGMRELGMWCVGEGLSETFADVEAILERGCRFSDCRHENEPGCAILSALKSGELAPERWKSYITLKREARFTDDRAAALREKTARNKGIAKFQKQYNRDARSRNR